MAEMMRPASPVENTIRALTSSARHALLPGALMKSSFFAALLTACALTFTSPALAAEPKINEPKAPEELKQAEDKLKTSQNKRSQREVQSGVKKLEAAGATLGQKLDETLNGGGSKAKKKSTKKKAAKKGR